LALVLISIISAANEKATAEQRHLQSFATRYALAWSGQDPAALAAFYVEDGVLQVNDGEPAIGRAAIRAKAKGFMEAFPDMVVKLESVEPGDGTAVFRWLWTGTNTGPGGTGRAVRLHGYEEWTFDETGLIRQSLGHYDEAEYRRQVNGAESEP
jgi:uncharacterized protein (TIGR02246 family)